MRKIRRNINKNSGSKIRDFSEKDGGLPAEEKQVNNDPFLEDCPGPGDLWHPPEYDDEYLELCEAQELPAYKHISDSMPDGISFSDLLDKIGDSNDMHIQLQKLIHHYGYMNGIVVVQVTKRGTTYFTCDYGYIKADYTEKRATF